MHLNWPGWSPLRELLAPMRGLRCRLLLQATVWLLSGLACAYMVLIFTDTAEPALRGAFHYDLLRTQTHAYGWIEVFPASLYVYSARISLAFSPQEVHLTAISHVRNEWVQRNTRCRCEFFTTQSDFLQSTKARLEHFGESQMGEYNGLVVYASSRFRCRLPTDPHRNVGLRLNCQRANVGGFADFLVEGLPDTLPDKYSFVHCGSPLWGGFNDSRGVVEFVEYYRQMGVARFIFYITSVSEEVKRVLEYYRKGGVTEIIPWVLPISDKEIWYFGQLAMMNDCFLRTAPYWDYTLNVDLDEFVATTGQIGLPDLARKNDSDCYVIPSSIVDLESRIRKTSVKTTVLTKRQKFIYPHNRRSKYFCRAKKVTEHGIHNPWWTVSGTVVEHAKADDVILLHYRAKLAVNEEPPEIRGLFVAERRALTFSTSFGVAANVEKVSEVLNLTVVNI